MADGLALARPARALTHSREQLSLELCWRTATAPGPELHGLHRSGSHGELPRNWVMRSFRGTACTFFGFFLRPFQCFCGVCQWPKRPKYPELPMREVAEGTQHSPESSGPLCCFELRTRRCLPTALHTFCRSFVTCSCPCEELLNTGARVVATTSAAHPCYTGGGSRFLFSNYVAAVDHVLLKALYPTQKLGFGGPPHQLFVAEYSRLC